MATGATGGGGRGWPGTINGRLGNEGAAGGMVEVTGGSKPRARNDAIRSAPAELAGAVEVDVGVLIGWGFEKLLGIVGGGVGC